MTEELDPGFEVLPQAAPRRPRRGARVLTALGAAVVLAGGGVATYAAFAGDDPGADPPQAAVAKVFDDLTHADLLGVIDDLAPGERDALRGAFTSDVASLKRLGVLTGTADPSSVAGVTFTARDLAYGTPLEVGDDAQIVTIDGGTVDVSASLAKLPLTRKLLDLAKADTSGAQTQHHTITADDPLRIGAQKVGGRWYASIMYTAADGAAHHRAPTAADRITAKGADSAENAVRTMITDLTSGKVRDAIALLSPTEMAAVQDYAGALADKAVPFRIPVTISSLDLTTKAVDGGTEVSLKKLEVAFHGQKVGIEIAGNCLKVMSPFLNKNLCGADIADTVSGFITSFTCSRGFAHGAQIGPASGSGTPAYRSRLHISYDPGSCAGPTFTTAQKTAFEHLFAGLLGSGVVTTQIGGQWYVAPMRTVADLTSSTLSALQGDDIFALASLAR